MRRKFPHEDLTEKVIGLAMEVHRELKPGLDEIFYEKAMVIELRRSSTSFTQQQSFSVEYKGEIIGSRIPDLIAGGAVVVDCKVVKSIGEVQIAQMLCYLRITELDIGLILNFNQASLEWKRVIRPRYWD